MSETVVQDAIEQFKDAESAESNLREMMRDDLEFASGEQWPTAIRRLREADQTNGPRPCLTVDKLQQYVRQVVNDTRQNRPSIKVRAGEDGDSGVAQIIQGLTRNIEDVSRADIAYDRGIEHAAQCGRGWLRVCTRYTGDETFEQDIYIASVADPLSVVLGLYTEPDGSDAECGFVTQELTMKKFERMYPKANPASFTPVDGWCTKDTVRVAEYYKKTFESKKLVMLKDSGLALFEDGLEDFKKEYGEKRAVVHDTRVVSIPRVRWYKLTAFDVLEETDWPSRWIPLVPVHGSEIWVENERILAGLIRGGKDAQRLYNYSRSTFAELVALAPKAPFIGAEGQFEGYEDEWAAANRVNLPYLTYKAMDVAGHQVPPPQRQPFAGVPTGLLQDMTTAEHDIQASIGMYSASVGQPSNERSGKAILARQREGDIGSYHYRDNLARSIRHVGRIIVDLIPKVYDTRRVLRIVGEDGVDKQVVLDPTTRRPVTELQLPNQEVRKIYNPSLGKYDVSIATGPGYTTKREEAASAILQLTQNAPQLFGIVGDLLVKSMDWPYADEIARRLRLLMPKELQQDEEGGGQQQIPPEAQQQIVMLTKSIQVLGEKAKEIQAENAKLKGIVDGKVIDHQIKKEEAQVKMRELGVREQEIALDMQKLEGERLKVISDSVARGEEVGLKKEELNLKRAELGQKGLQLVAEASEGEEGAEEAEGAAGEEEETVDLEVVKQVLVQIQKGVEALAGGVESLEQRVAAQEKQNAGLAQKVEEIVAGAQTAAVIPRYNERGEIVGGIVVQQDGTRREIDLALKGAA